MSLIPINNGEGVKIVAGLIGGLIKAGLTFSLNDQLLTSIKDGVKYLFKKASQAMSRETFKTIQYIEMMKGFVI